MGIYNFSHKVFQCVVLRLILVYNLQYYSKLCECENKNETILCILYLFKLLNYC